MVVLAAIPDKVAVSPRYGACRLANRQANPEGWISCFSVDRPDERRPSAMISEHDRSGYMDFRDGRTRSKEDII